MRYPGSEKLEIIRTVEASHLPARQTLAMLGIPRTTYYRWYDRWSEGGLDALEDTAPHPGSVWNRLPDETRVVSRIWWKLCGSVLRAIGFGPDQAARSRLIGSIG